MSATSPSKEELARVHTRASLLGRLKDLEDSRSWREFFDAYWRVIYRFAIRCGATEAEAEDVVQEAVITVAKKIPAFEYQPEEGRFSSWLFAITRKYVRKQQAKRGLGSNRVELDAEEGSGRSWLELIPDPASLEPDTAWNEEWKQNLLAVATERAKARVNPLDYQRYDYWVNQGHSPADTARDLGCAENTVYSARHRVEKAIKDEAARLRKKLY